MKKSIIILITVLSVFKMTAANGQKDLKYIQTIDEFGDSTYYEFQLHKSSQKEDITMENIKVFYIFLSKSVFKDAKVFARNNAGQYEELTIATLESANANDNLVPVRVNKAAVKEGTVVIQIKLGERIMTLVFAIERPKIPGDLRPRIVCKPLTRDNYFGELGLCDSYDCHKIVYVYDFQTKATYKVFRICDKGELSDPCELDVEPVNFSSELLKPKNSVLFKVININKFIYKSTISNADIFFESEPSPLFTQLFVGDSSLLGDLLSVFSSSIIESPEKAGQQSFDEADNALAKALKKVRDFMVNYNKLHESVLKAYSQCENFECCEDLERAEYAKLANELLDVKIQFTLVQATLNEKKDQLKKLQDEIKACEKAAEEVAAIQKQIDPIEKKKEGERTEDEKKKLAELTDKKSKIKLCAGPDLESKNTAMKKLEEEIKAFGIITEINGKLPSEQELRKLVVFVNNMVSFNQQHLIGPISPYGNRLDITLQFELRPGISEYMALPFDKDSVSYQIPVIHKPFISFSAGTFAASDNIKNKTYQWQQIPEANNTVSDTSSYSLVESGFSEPVMGFAALGNLEWKLCKSFGIGFSFGAGLTIESEPRPSYLVGLSFFLGDLRQLTVTGGLIGMNVNKLTNNLQAVADGGILYKDPPEVEYYKVFQHGTFVSLTYTPFSIKTNKKK